MKLFRLALTLIAGSVLLVSCSSDDDQAAPSGAYANGMLILNQGAFMANNASVSFLSDDFVLENNIFANVTGTGLGDTAQSIGFYKDLAYIVVNFSNTIEIVNRYTFAKVATIQGLENPRYIAFANGKGYVTNWGDGGEATDDYVAIINLQSHTIDAEIPVAEGPERILAEDNRLYIAHTGGYGYNDIVTVINAENSTTITTIRVGDVPEGIAIEDNNLYVLSKGMPSWGGTEGPGRLDVISLANNTITKTINFTGLDHPTNLTIEDDKLYYTVNSKIYSMAINASALPTAPLFETTEQGVYGVSAFTVDNGHIYVGDAGDFASAGKVYVYTPDGMLHHTFTVGIAPEDFYFND